MFNLYGKIKRGIKILLWMLTFFPVTTLFAQTENWVYRYNTTANDSDCANSVVYGVDGNIYAAGFSSGIETGRDFTVISITDSGVENWVYRYDGPGNSEDCAYSIVYGSDGNIYVAGFSTGAGTGFDFTVISLNASGDTNWTYRYDGPENNDDCAYSIVYGEDGNIYASGKSTNTGSGLTTDFTVISLSDAGVENWIYKYNGPGNYFDCSYSIVYGADGNIYAAGYSEGNNTYKDFTVVSLTNAGTENWVYTYSAGNSNDQARSLVYGLDGNIYAAGWTFETLATQYDFTIISLNATAGDTNWIYKYNGPAGPGWCDDFANSIVYGSDSNIYGAGYSRNKSGYNYDFLVIGVTNGGAEKWVYRYNGPADWNDFANSIVYGNNGNIYVTGSISGANQTYYNIPVVSLDTSGNENWFYTYNGPGSDYDEAFSIVCSNGNIYAAGYSTGSSTSHDFTVISLSENTGIDEQYIFSSSGEFTLTSPFFMDEISIRFTSSSVSPLGIALYNILGQRVFLKSLPNTPSSLHLTDKKLSSLPTGVYFLSIHLGKKAFSKIKLIKF